VEKDYLSDIVGVYPAITAHTEGVGKIRRQEGCRIITTKTPPDRGLEGKMRSETNPLYIGNKRTDLTE